MRQNLEHLIIPPDQPEPTTSYSMSNNGVFSEGDIVIGRQGCIIGTTDSPGSTRPSSRSSACSSVDVFAPHQRPSGDDYDEQAHADLCNMTLGDLEDVGVVGNGSSGVVYKVRCKRNNLVLVKKVIPFDARCEETRKRVCMELRTLYGAGSPYVVKYYQSFLANGAITIVMEYLDGGSLADILKRARKLSEPYLAEVARQVLAGLHYLHRDLKVMHRDIKPSNLLVSSKGELKISDFGVSGPLATSVAQCHSWVGTVTYFSPERIRGVPYTADSDVWSLGLSIVELALGRYPYPPPGEERRELAFFDLLEYVVNEPAPQLPSTFTPELRDFVARCLSKEPSARPSVEQLMSHPWLARHPRVSLANLVSGNSMR